MQRIRKFVLSRRALAFTAVTWVVIILGCMSISIGGKHISTGTCENGAFVQDGKVHLGAGCSQVVHYPIPYAAVPNLEIDSCLHQCEVTIQREDYFVVVNNGVFGRTVEWTARGVRAAPPPPSPTLPPPTLPPPTPLPIEK